MSTEQQFSAAWQRFLLGKQAMLAEYDRARSHALTQAVAAHHGHVAEAAVRDWLATFLPKRFGVTSGYIRSQGFTDIHQSAHFDAIIYDQLEAPTLWIEENRDKSDGGRARIIPAESVGAVLEVKATFNRRSVADAAQKIAELAPLMAGIDATDERYPKYLPASALMAIVCFELHGDDGHDQAPLAIIRDISINRPFYGAVILRGEGRDPSDTAVIQQTVGDQPYEALFVDAGLLHGTAIAKTTEVDGHHRGALMMWADINFSRFAFDLLATLKGTYKPGYASSLHGLDFTAWKPKG